MLFPKFKKEVYILSHCDPQVFSLENPVLDFIGWVLKLTSSSISIGEVSTLDHEV